VGDDLAGIDALVRWLLAERSSIDGDGAAIAERASLAELGLDSAAILSLVVGLEEEFGIEIADFDIIPDNFGNLERIARFVARRVSR
jgi:acyl carrier protein